MLEKIRAFYNVFRAGQSVANPRALKQAQLATNIAALLGAVVVLGRLFNYDLHLDDGEIVTLSGAIAIVLGLFNIGATVASTNKIGLPAAPAQFPAIDSDAVITARMSAATAQPVDTRPVAKPAPALRVVPAFFRDDDHSGS